MLRGEREGHNGDQKINLCQGFNRVVVGRMTGLEEGSGSLSRGQGREMNSNGQREGHHTTAPRGEGP